MKLNITCKEAIRQLEKYEYIGCIYSSDDSLPEYIDSNIQGELYCIECLDGDFYATCTMQDCVERYGMELNDDDPTDVTISTCSDDEFEVIE